MRFRPLACIFAVLFVAAALVAPSRLPVAAAATAPVDLSVSITDMVDPLPADVPVSFTVRVRATGGTPSPGATVSVWSGARHPLHLETGNCLAQADGGWKCGLGLGSFPVDRWVTVAKLWVTNDIVGTFTTSAWINADGSDPDPTNDTDQEPTTLTEGFSALGLSSSASTLEVGHALDVTATVTDRNGAPVPDGTPVTFNVDGRVLDAARERWVGLVPTPAGSGYGLVSATGTSLALGDAVRREDPAPADVPFVDAVATSSGRGHWIVASNGAVRTFGDARLFGSMEGHPLGGPNIVGMAPTPTGLGYWLVSAGGDVFSFGDARFFGPPAPLADPVVAMEATSTGRGYWLVTDDGTVHAFGDAFHLGDLHDLALNSPVVDFASAPTGTGYWMVAADGGIFSFGDAKFLGSMGGRRLAAPIARIVPHPVSRFGYWLVGTDGAVFAFGEARFFGPAVSAATSSGQARASFSLTLAKVTPVSAGVPGGPTSSDAMVTWTPGRPSALTLEPRSSQTVVGYGRTLTATVVDSFGNPTGQGDSISFTAGGTGGESPTSAVARTVSGRAAFTVVGSVTGRTTVAASGLGLLTSTTILWVTGGVPPSPPAVVQASAGEAAAFVTWTEPESDGGGPITGYTVTASPGGRAIEVPGDTTWAAFTGLDNGTTYVFTVVARNAFGAGEPSPASNPVTPSGQLTGAGPASPGGPGSPAGDSAAPARSGYWMLGSDGAVYAFGDAPYMGNPQLPAGATALDLEPTPSGNGYWVLDSTGTIHCRGDARDYGDLDHFKLDAFEQFTSLSVTPNGEGYWIFTSQGGVYTFGNARMFGSLKDRWLNGPVLDSMSTPSGRGYYMVASDGGIFTFGDAVFAGSMGGTRLNAPVQSLAPDGDGAGYWLVASDGGIFAFDAPFRGSLGSVRLNRPITGMVRFGDGYLMVGEDGGIFNFSNRPFRGSLGDNPPAHPVVAVAALG